MNRQKLSGAEDVVTIKIRGGRDATFRRTQGLWQCVEFPIPKPCRSLRVAIDSVRRKLNRPLCDRLDG